MGNPHDIERTWGQRFGDRLLNLLSTKFILGLGGLTASTFLAWNDKMDGTNFALVVLGLAGVHGVVNAAIERIHTTKTSKPTFPLLPPPSFEDPLAGLPDGGR